MFISVAMSILLLTNAEASLLQSLLPYASDRETERIHGLLTGQVKATPLDRYCPHKPFPKQRAFLGLDCLEAFYGGAAGPGKSDALLMAALDYIDQPQYSALILRRDYKRLSLPSSIMDRAKHWLFPHEDVRWSGQDYLFRFPSGATLQFGYIDNPDDRFRYASSEYQFLGFDELTEFRLQDDDSNPYLFMFSRLRKTHDNPVPLRVRSASNPGNVGHRWVKERFVTDEAIAAIRDDRPRVFYADEQARERAFVPALLRDNPAVDADQYIKNLMHLPPVTRQRLLAGDWSIIDNAMIKAEWLRYYQMRGQIIQLLNRDGTILGMFDEREAQHFGTIDTAGTSEQKAKEAKGKPHSWSVAAVWCRPPQKFGNILILRDIWRKRVEFPELLAGLRDVQRKWRLPKWKIENAHAGPQVWSMLRGEMPMELASHEGKGKVERNAPFLNMLSRGEVYLPRYDNDWRPTLEAEWLVWTGLDEETADQIDVGGYAAREVFQTGGVWGGVIKN